MQIGTFLLNDNHICLHLTDTDKNNNHNNAATAPLLLLHSYKHFLSKFEYESIYYVMINVVVFAIQITNHSLKVYKIKQKRLH